MAVQICLEAPLNILKGKVMQKKIYVVLTKQYTDCEGRNWRVEREYVTTADIATYVELKKIQIESQSYWWMDYCSGADKRPYVEAEVLNIKEV